MAMVNISLDTKTRQVVLTVNGVLVSCESCGIDKWVDSEDVEHLSFHYTITDETEQGMKETRRFYLPEASVGVSAEAEGEGEKEEVVEPDEETGLVSEVVEQPIQPDDEDIQKDLKDVFGQP